MFKILNLTRIARDSFTQRLESLYINLQEK